MLFLLYEFFKLCSRKLCLFLLEFDCLKNYNGNEKIRNFEKISDTVCTCNHNPHWNELSSVTRCIWWKVQVDAIEPSDHNDWVSIHNRFSNKKAYTERVDCSPVYIFLSEIVNKFLTSAILAAMIYSTNTKIYFKRLFKYLL